jgi:outer membrane protein assembly factor BamB
MNTRRSLILHAALALLLAASASADWLEYRGPTQNGIAAEKLTGTLPAAPKVLWKTRVGLGTAAVTVNGDRAFTMGNTDQKNDTVVCLDVRTGKVAWKHEFPLAPDPNMFEGGPRSTPTIDGNVVYTLSHQGDLWALNAGTGKPIWYKHLQKDFGGRRPGWGYAGSPTIEGNLVLIDSGGEGSSTLALNKTTGALVWKSGSDKAGYASVVVADLGGKRTVLVFKSDALVGLDLKDGREQWRTAWKTDYGVNAATPIVIGDSVLITSGYGTGAALLEIGSGGVTQKWRNKSLRSHFNSPVVHQGHVYGIDGNAGGGNLVCLELATGNVKWTEKSVKGGSLILADSKLICLTEKGELVICEATPGGFKASLRAPVLDKRCWVQPTLSGGRLFVKNNDGDLVCLAL